MKRWIVVMVVLAAGCGEFEDPAAPAGLTLSSERGASASTSLEIAGHQRSEILFRSPDYGMKIHVRGDGARSIAGIENLDGSFVTQAFRSHPAAEYTLAVPPAEGQASNVTYRYRLWLDNLDDTTLDATIELRPYGQDPCAKLVAQTSPLARCQGFVSASGRLDAVAADLCVAQPNERDYELVGTVVLADGSTRPIDMTTAVASGGLLKSRVASSRAGFEVETARRDGAVSGPGTVVKETLRYDADLATAEYRAVAREAALADAWTDLLALSLECTPTGGFYEGFEQLLFTGME